MSTIENSYFITTILPDRIGILSTVTGTIFNHGGNLSDVRQMLLGGMFSLSCTASFDSEIDANNLKAAVMADLHEPAAHVIVMKCQETETTSSVASGERYVAAVSGPDKPGRVHRVSSIFAKFGVNVEDWRYDMSNPAKSLTIGIVRVPLGCDVRKLEADLVSEMRTLGLSASLRHENIFRATNEVGPISALFAKHI